MTLPSRAALAALVLGALVPTACDLAGDPQTSYCESLCDWATTCSSGERGYYPEYSDSETSSSCLTSAEAADPDCAKSADGLNAASAALLTKCTDAVDGLASADECGAITGRIDELKLATTPTECASQGIDAQTTFDAARDGAAETNDQLCNRFTWTFCDQVQTCMLESLGVASVDDIPQELVDRLGTPFDLCEDRLGTENSTCVSTSLYAPEADLTDANLHRQGARDCLADFSQLSCDDLFGGNVAPTCAAAPSDADAFFGALAGIAVDYLDSGK